MAIIFAVIGMVFFAVPDISVIDILPDVIACLLLYFALSVPSEFSSKLVEARTTVLKLTFITGADLIISSMISYDDPTMILLVSFCFGLAEAFMLYISVEKIFDGLSYLGTRFPAKGIYFPMSEKKREKYSEKLFKTYEKAAVRLAEKGKTVSAEYIKERVEYKTAQKSDTALKKLIRKTHWFIIIRAALNILPEFTALSSYSYQGDVNAAVFDIARFRGLFVVFAVFLSAVAGIIWLISIIKYLIGIKRDKPFIDAMMAAYKSDVTANSGLLYYRRMRLATLLLSLGVVLSFDFTLDHINMIPDFITPAFMILFWLCFIRDKKKPIVPIAMSLAYAVFAAVQWFLVKWYIGEFYDFTRTLKNERAMTMYIVCCVLTLIAEVLYVFMLRPAFKRINGVIYESTGFLTQKGESDDYSKKLHDRLAKQNNIAMLFSIVTAVTSVAYMILLGINKGVEAMQEGVVYITYVPVFESIGVLQMMVNVLYIIYTVKHLSDVKDGLDERYDLQ